jgi:hypothetical protein
MRRGGESSWSAESSRVGGLDTQRYVEERQTAILNKIHRLMVCQAFVPLDFDAIDLAYCAVVLLRNQGYELQDD